QVSEDLQSEVRFQLEEAIRARDDLEQRLIAERARFEAEKNALREQIAAMQGSMIEALERSNNPSRVALAVREQVGARIAEEKQDWQLQWEGERRRLNAEIDRLRKFAGGPSNPTLDANKRAILEKLGKLPAGSAPRFKTADQWEKELQDAKIQWDAERD